MNQIDINNIKKVHFVGIKGVAMTALAVWAKERGWTVSGSDVEEVFPTDAVLKEKNITWNVGFDQNHVRNCDLVVVTGAHGGMNNVEAKQAKSRGIPTIMQGEVLGLFTTDKRVIAVAGSHGKTTTSALTAHILTKTHNDPSFIVGCGNIPSIGAPAHFGKGDYFVVEADEYINCPGIDTTPKFLFLNPHICVITNIEYDHPDAYNDIDAVNNAFKAFIERTRQDGTLIACIDNQHVKALWPTVKGLSKISYGFSPDADYQIKNVSFHDGKTHFSVHHSESIDSFELSIPGEHNALNAVAAILASKTAGVAIEQIKKVLPSFTGTKRRFELVNVLNGSTIYDDYAHHPTEINATLKAAKAWYPNKKITAIFQPHTYSRTKALFKEFVAAFGYADTVVITDIYASSRESVDPTISGKMLADSIEKPTTVFYRPGKADVVQYIRENARQDNLIITMGAGDIWTWLEHL